MAAHQWSSAVGHGSSLQATTANHIPRAQMGLSLRRATRALSAFPASSTLRGENDPDEIPNPTIDDTMRNHVGRARVRTWARPRSQFSIFENLHSSHAQERANRGQPDQIWVNGNRRWVHHTRHDTGDAVCEARWSFPVDLYRYRLRPFGLGVA